jgi:hypothetical protein
VTKIVFYNKTETAKKRVGLTLTLTVSTRGVYRTPNSDSWTTCQVGGRDAHLVIEALSCVFTCKGLCAALLHTIDKACIFA